MAEMTTGNKVKVFDAEGVERMVDPVDAREIVAAGGSFDGEEVPPIKAKAKQTHPAEAGKEEVQDDKAKSKPKSK